MKLILTPTLKIASNDKERAHLFELTAQRITQYVEPHYVSDDMLRGMEDEHLARALYCEHYAPCKEVGFVTNDKWGFVIGYSPDAIVGDDGLIECKSRRQRFQVQTIASGLMPDDYILQCQTGLLVSERKFLDFVSYSAGLPMVVIRIYPDRKIQAAIVESATAFMDRMSDLMMCYDKNLELHPLWVPTERIIEQEMQLS
jgi:predicted phage-related endonuclease